MDELFRVGLNNAAWATGLAIVAAAGSRIWRSRPAVCHALWLLVLLKLATPSVLKVDEVWSDPKAGDRQIVEQPRNSTRPGPFAQIEVPPSRRAAQIVAAKGDASLGRAYAEPDRPAPARVKWSTVRSWPWRTMMVLVWFTGAGIWWGFVALSSFRFRRLLASVVAAPEELQERVRREAARMGLSARLTPRVGIVPVRVPPLVWASLFSPPRLLLPQELWGRLDVLQQNAVLAHELAHLKRKDHLVRWLEAIVLGIYWWDPVAWWARREIERAEEESCDAWVLWAQPKAAGAYALALVATTAFLSGVSSPLPIGASGVSNTHSLKRRLKMILSDAENSPVTRSRSWKLLAIGAVCLPLLPVPTSGTTSGSPAAVPRTQAPANNETASPAQPQGPALPSAPPKGQSRVRVSRPAVRRVGEYVDADGRLQSANRVDIKAAVGGILKKVVCKPAQRVKRGDVLFEIDSRAFALEVQKAEAEIKRLHARLKAVRGQAGAVDREKRDREFIARAQAEHEDAEASLLVAQATLDLARLKLESTRVTAPIDGVVSRLMQSEGDYVEAGNTALAKIVATDFFTADFYVEEPVARRLDQAGGNRENAAGVSIRVGVRGESGFPRPASLDFVDPEVQPVAETAVRVSVRVPNSDGSLRNGLFARVRVTLGPPRDSVLVADEAVKMEGDRRCVYVLSDRNIVERRFVQAAFKYDSFRAVESGLRSDEWVIVDGSGAARVGRSIPEAELERISASAEPSEKPLNR